MGKSNESVYAVESRKTTT